MNNDEKQIVIKSFATQLSKEAGLSSMWSGAKNLFNAGKNTFKGGIGNAPGAFDAASGAFDKSMVAAQNIGAHLGRNKKAYGVGAVAGTAGFMAGSFKNNQNQQY